MRSEAATPSLVDRDVKSKRPVVAWLYVLAALVMLMVVVGGATRLTESGLSITEWKPVTGAIPPLSAGDWQGEFDKYRQIPQYQLLNRGMSLEAFKTIYWWEWTHRFLGRLVGFAFLIPFLFFAATGRIGRRDYPPLIGLFVLGGLQGFVGWFMVASGLVERVSVSQYRLAVHLTLACVIFAAIVWVARGMQACGRPAETSTGAVRLGAGLLLGLVVVQIFLGGLVAGLDAGLTYNTWPLMDGRLVPSAASLFVIEPAWRNLFENVLTVQFLHRMVAYLIFALSLWHAASALSRLPGTPAARRAVALAALVTVQAIVGIVTLVTSVPIGIALLHQAGAVLVLGMATVHAHATGRAGQGLHGSRREAPLRSSP